VPLQTLRQADLDIRPIQSSLIYDKFSRHCLQAGESHHIMKIASVSVVFAHSARHRWPHPNEWVPHPSPSLWLRVESHEFNPR
jgi:hypothetical protein